MSGFIWHCSLGDVLYLVHVLNIQLFREKLSEKMCTRQSRKVMWDMFNTLFLTLQLSNLLLLLSFSTRRHMSIASRALLSNFLEKQCTQNHPQYLSGLSRALYPTTFLEIAVYKSYMWTAERRIKWRMIIVVTYATFAVAKRAPEKNSGLYRIRTLNPRALHRYRGQGFESRTNLNFFSGFLFATAKVAYITAMIILHLRIIQ